MNTSENSLSRTFIIVWLAALLVVAAVIRVGGVGEYHYSSDEAADVDMAKGDSVAEVVHYSMYETHPPLGHILRHYWMKLSADPAFVRGLSLVFGLALILLYYRIGAFLNGPLMGVWLAVLIAFSHGLIIQSYVVRNYTIFLFILSLGFYAYLRWRTNHCKFLLACYGALGILACFTHFAGIFAIFPIAAYETIALFRRKTPWTIQIQWVITNLIIALVEIITYSIWQKALAPYLTGHLQLAFYKLLLGAAFYPLLTIHYILPFKWAIVLAASTLPFAVINDKPLRSFLIICGMAFGLGMLLVLSSMYTFLGSRHSLWLIPFVITPIGWACADCCKMIAAKYKFTFAWQQLLAVALIVVGSATYSETARFDNSDPGNAWEYQIKNVDWQHLKDYLTTLDSKHIIVVESSDLFVLGSAEHIPYYYRDLAKNSNKPVVIPYYGQQHIFYAPENIPADDWQEYFKDKTTLVFVETSASATIDKLHLIPLMLCDALPKEIVTFPARSTNQPLTREEILTTPAIAILISKKDFFEQVVAPNGKAHGCLGQK